MRTTIMQVLFSQFPNGHPLYYTEQFNQRKFNICVMKTNTPTTMVLHPFWQQHLFLVLSLRCWFCSVYFYQTWNCWFLGENVFSSFQQVCMWTQFTEYYVTSRTISSAVALYLQSAKYPYQTQEMPIFVPARALTPVYQLLSRHWS